jgi:hypothetical protein
MHGGLFGNRFLMCENVKQKQVEQANQRGLNSKRGPRSFHPLFPSAPKRYIIASKAYQILLKMGMLY